MHSEIYERLLGLFSASRQRPASVQNNWADASRLLERP